MSADGFRKELERLINRESRENGSDTPDFLLADYLCACLVAYDTTVCAREKWYGRGAPSDPKQPPVDNEHVAAGATLFTDDEIRRNR